MNTKLIETNGNFRYILLGDDDGATSMNSQGFSFNPPRDYQNINLGDEAAKVAMCNRRKEVNAITIESIASLFNHFSIKWTIFRLSLRFGV